MKFIRPLLLFLSAFMALTVTSLASVVFTFVDEDSEVSADPFDGGGIGATMTETDGTSTIVLTTVDILFPEYDASSGEPVATGKTISTTVSGGEGSTNIGGSTDALGVNNPQVSNSDWKNVLGAGGSEGSDFNAGEAWVIQFNTDVIINEIELESMAADNTLTITVDDKQVASFDFLTDGEFYTDPLGGLLISAGANVNFAASGPIATTDYRIKSIKVSIPESSMVALVGIVGLIATMRRRLS